MELFVSLDGVGLSVVNSKPDEVAYIKLRRYVSPSHGFYDSCPVHYGENSQIFQITNHMSKGRWVKFAYFPSGPSGRRSSVCSMKDVGAFALPPRWDVALISESLVLYIIERCEIYPII